MRPRAGCSSKFTFGFTTVFRILEWHADKGSLFFKISSNGDFDRTNSLLVLFARVQGEH